MAERKKEEWGWEGPTFGVKKTCNCRNESFLLTSSSKISPLDSQNIEPILFSKFNDPQKSPFVILASTFDLDLAMCCTDFAAVLFNFFFKRRSREINGGEANEDAAANDETARGTSSTHTSTGGQEVATSSGYDYEVFLSFRGPDTRAGFTDFLYTSLKGARIRAFRDDEELRKGEEFAPELINAIKQSKISIPIFSKGYASSVWCLKELVHMVECQKNGRQKIMPIFYDVAPSEVRHQTGDYAEAFRSHEKKQRYDEETMCRWRDALRAVGAINGWDLHSEGKNRQEGLFVKTVTQKVFNELKKAYLEVSDYLVSVDDQVDEIMKMIGAHTSETRIIGIYGMGGIGKTTIAKIIYNQLSHNLKDCCFLPDIRETSKGKGIQSLQNQLLCDILKIERLDIKDIYHGTQIIKDRLSNKRVLLFLDDVHEKNHMDALVGERKWFGEGTRLIITTRNKGILNVLEVDGHYEVSGMDSVQSLQLFSKHAFRRDSPLDDYINQSNRAIGIAGGLPLALEVIGSLLSRTKKEIWDDILEKLEKIPNAEIEHKLRISYDALECEEKHIFLDIACLFIGYDKDILVHFWDASQLFPKVAMDILQNMSLIKIIEDNKVWMHDQLRDLGRRIVRRESKEINKRSRVWDPEEALDLLRRHKGEKEVKALRLEFDHEEHYSFTDKDFESLSKLKFLEVDCWTVNFSSKENSVLFPQLLWLSWHHIPRTFEITNLFMKNAVILDLSSNEVTHDWKWWSHMKVMKNLKVLNLTNCHRLERTPNFFVDSNLERLILRGCHKIVEIDMSICQLKRLVFLDLSECRSLQRLPDELGRDLASLEYLYLRNCEKLERLPDIIENLESLIELDISYTKIKELPDSIGKLKNLRVVKMSRSGISKIPNDLWTIEKLEVIEGCMNNEFDVEIDNCICNNRSLRILRLTWVRMNALPRLPETLVILALSYLRMDTFPDLSNLTNLKELWLGFDPRRSDGPVEEYPMPRWIENLNKLESLNVLFAAFVTTLPTDIFTPLPRLQELSLDCPNLRCCLPGLASSLSSLDLRSDCLTTLPTDFFTLLPRLQELQLRCPNLRCLPSLPSSLSSLVLDDCGSLCSMGDLSHLKELSSLNIRICENSEIQGLDRLENLGDLNLQQLQQVKMLPDLSNLNKLRHLSVRDCGNLVEIQGEPPPSLEEFKIIGCGSLQKLPDLSSLKGLRRVFIQHCGQLNVEAISSLARRSQSYLCETDRIRWTRAERCGRRRRRIWMHI